MRVAIGEIDGEEKTPARNDITSVVRHRRKIE
jgi:hypothetical protein